MVAEQGCTQAGALTEQRAVKAKYDVFRHACRHFLAIRLGTCLEMPLRHQEYLLSSHRARQSAFVFRLVFRHVFGHTSNHQATRFVFFRWASAGACRSKDRHTRARKEVKTDTHRHGWKQRQTRTDMDGSKDRHTDTDRSNDRHTDTDESKDRHTQARMEAKTDTHRHGWKQRQTHTDTDGSKDRHTQTRMEKTDTRTRIEAKTDTQTRMEAKTDTQHG